MARRIVWRGKAARKCYDSALALALQHKCESVAFSLMSAGNHGFPKPLALQTAMNAISEFLMEYEMRIYLVVFSRDAFRLSEKLLGSVSSFIDETYILDKTLDEYGVTNKCTVRGAQQELILREQMRRQQAVKESTIPEPRFPCGAAPAAATPATQTLESMLKQTDQGFSEPLLRLIHQTGQKDSVIYKKANVDRKLFSKIRNNPGYKPSMATALAFAIALELDLPQTKDLIGRAGYALTHSSKFDIIIEYFITHRNYNLFEINETLFYFDQSLLGG